MTNRTASTATTTANRAAPVVMTMTDIVRFYFPEEDDWGIKRQTSIVPRPGDTLVHEGATWVVEDVDFVLEGHTVMAANVTLDYSNRRSES